MVKYTSKNDLKHDIIFRKDEARTGLAKLLPVFVDEETLLVPNI